MRSGLFARILLPGAVCLLFVASAGLLLSSANAQAGQRLFPETNHTVGGRFLQYWTENGGLPQQGFPISEEMNEVSDLDGSSHKVQYFERAVFEEHLENKPPYDVLLSQLGTFRYKAKYGDTGAPLQRPNTAGQLFKETNHYVGGIFLTYWQTHGGLAQQGFPISEEFDEVSDLDGKTYTVQYFERAVFEIHPENPPPYNVLLSQLGTFRLKEKYPNGAPFVPPSVPTVYIPPAIPTTAAQPSTTPAPSDTGNCNPVNESRKSTIGTSGAVGISSVKFSGQEYVEITNSGGAPANLGGWILRDKNDTAQTYRFADGTALPAGGTIQVFTEPGHPYTFNSQSSIWNNCGDALELVDSSGAVVSTYAYGTHLK